MFRRTAISAGSVLLERLARRIGELEAPLRARVRGDLQASTGVATPEKWRIPTAILPLDEARLQLRVDEDEDDPEVTAVVTAARSSWSRLPWEGKTCD